MEVYISNKKAKFDYEILESYEAGIELLGFEVKSIRGGHGSIEGAYVLVRGGEAFLSGMTVPPYQEKNTSDEYDSMRLRKLILSKTEIKELGEFESKKGLTIVPIVVYNKGRKIKLAISVVRGKKQFDKREKIKKRETDIDIRRTLKYE